MSLPKAYCLEVDRVIDIFEAHALFFAQRLPRRRFNLKCPDNDCRKANNPEVIGVNYDKKPDENEFVQRPHFRLKKGTVHSDNCPWAEVVAALDELEKEDGPSHLSHLKKSELVNVFKPLAEGEEGNSDQFDIDAAFLAGIRRLTDRRERIDALKGYLRGALNSTSRLHEVVRCYMTMSDEERRAENLSIPPYGTKPYRTWFRFVKFCRASELPLIHYGAVNVKKYRSGYSLKFWCKAEQPDRVVCDISTFIAESRIRAFRGGKILQETLDVAIQLQETQHRYPIDVFVFGTSLRSIEGTRLEIAFESLHSLVVMLTDRGL